MFDKADEKLGEVLERTEDSGWLGLSLTYYFLAESYLGQDQLKYAEKAAREALGLGTQTEAKASLGAAWRVLGKVASRKGSMVEIMGKSMPAEDCFQRSANLFREMGANDELAHTLKPWAEHELIEGDQKKGEIMWEEARKIFLDLDMPAEVNRMDKGKEGRKRQ